MAYKQTNRACPTIVKHCFTPRQINNVKQWFRHCHSSGTCAFLYVCVKQLYIDTNYPLSSSEHLILDATTVVAVTQCHISVWSTWSFILQNAVYRHFKLIKSNPNPNLDLNLNLQFEDDADVGVRQCRPPTSDRQHPILTPVILCVPSSIELDYIYYYLDIGQGYIKVIVCRVLFVCRAVLHNFHTNNPVSQLICSLVPQPLHYQRYKRSIRISTSLVPWPLFHKHSRA